MSIDQITLPDCLERCADGAIRVHGHRVSLYLVLDALYAGKSAGELRSLYPTIPDDRMRDVILYCGAHGEIMSRYYVEQRQRNEITIRSMRPNGGPTLTELQARREQRRNRG